jgi:hypothetical protein
VSEILHAWVAVAPEFTTAIDARLFKPLPALIFFSKILQIRARTIVPSIIANPRPARHDHLLHIRDRREHAR